MTTELTLENILRAAVLAVVVYALTQPFRRFIDERLEKEIAS